MSLDSTSDVLTTTTTGDSLTTRTSHATVSAVAPSGPGSPKKGQPANQNEEGNTIDNNNVEKTKVADIASSAVKIETRQQPDLTEIVAALKRCGCSKIGSR